MSRPAGREASLAAISFLKLSSEKELIELDFTGVKVVAPSWLDEFIQGLKKHYKNEVRCLPSENPTVIESLKVL